MGMTLAPLTTAGIAGVAADDAGAASGVVNAAQQLGGSLGLSILVTVFTAASHSATTHPVAGASPAERARDALAHAVSSAVTGSTVLLALALLVIVITVRPRRQRVSAVVAEVA